MNRHGFCIFINTVIQGPVPSMREGIAENSDESGGRICVFASEREAQIEIADFMMTRLREFMDGEREFEDAMTVEEYVVEVDAFSDGTIVDADGNSFR